MAVDSIIIYRHISCYRL